MVIQHLSHKLYILHPFSYFLYISNESIKKKNTYVCKANMSEQSLAFQGGEGGWEKNIKEISYSCVCLCILCVCVCVCVWWR